MGGGLIALSVVRVLRSPSSFCFLTSHLFLRKRWTISWIISGKSIGERGVGEGERRSDERLMLEANVNDPMPAWLTTLHQVVVNPWHPGLSNCTFLHFFFSLDLPNMKHGNNVQKLGKTLCVICFVFITKNVR